MHTSMGSRHGIDSSTRLTAADAHEVARVMQALATPSRVRILGRLREGAASVGELASATEMAQPAVSHQLRILRNLRLVTGARQGRHIVYELFDHHVAQLLDESLRHVDHLRAGTEQTRAADNPAKEAA